MDWSPYGAALFDLDGVITPTAEIHMRAWSEMFNDFLSSRGVAEPYTDQDYYNHVDGRPRYDGVRTFLASRGIELPEGDPGDSADRLTVCGLGNRKNDVFNAVLDRDGVTPYPGSLRLIRHLLGLGINIAVVSSSRNARPVLDAAGLGHTFEVVVDGKVAEEKGLAGKPDPATFLYATSLMGFPHFLCVVIEDAVSGIVAAREGRFGLVVGVDRGAGRRALLDAGAHIVVSDLAELV